MPLNTKFPGWFYRVSMLVIAENSSWDGDEELGLNYQHERPEFRYDKDGEPEYVKTHEIYDYDDPSGEDFDEDLSELSEGDEDEDEDEEDEDEDEDESEDEEDEGCVKPEEKDCWCEPCLKDEEDRFQDYNRMREKRKQVIVDLREQRQSMVDYERERELIVNYACTKLHKNKTSRPKTSRSETSRSETPEQEDWLYKLYSSKYVSTWDPRVLMEARVEQAEIEISTNRDTGSDSWYGHIRFSEGNVYDLEDFKTQDFETSKTPGLSVVKVGIRGQRGRSSGTGGNISITFFGEHFLKLVVPSHLAYDDGKGSIFNPDFLEFCGIEMDFEFGYEKRLEGKFDKALAKVRKSYGISTPQKQTTQSSTQQEKSSQTTAQKQSKLPSERAWRKAYQGMLEYAQVCQDVATYARAELYEKQKTPDPETPGLDQVPKPKCYRLFSTDYLRSCDATDLDISFVFSGKSCGIDFDLYHRKNRISFNAGHEISFEGYQPPTTPGLSSQRLELTGYKDTITIDFVGQHLMVLTVPSRVAYADDRPPPPGVPEFLVFGGVTYDFEGREGFNELVAKMKKASEASIMQGQTAHALNPRAQVFKPQNPQETSSQASTRQDQSTRPSKRQKQTHESSKQQEEYSQASKPRAQATLDGWLRPT